MAKMMKQFQKAQADMNRMQEELVQKTVESSSGGGAVRVVVNGQKNLVSLRIDPEVMAEDNREMLEDLIIAAVNEAFNKVDELISSEMRRLTGGLNLPPGMF
ncbi:MAG TPA: YbaB/EbfC family nucleoid-associated protein [Candidatus Limnocylindrales bacterium]|nr:YbaB/EbfC family nucleoid-associated protein [Candidatus Limnocylindrales bacterium]